MRAADPHVVRALVDAHSPRPTEHWRDIASRPCCWRALVIITNPETEAVYGFCVCAWREVCPDHGLTHVGTHD